MTYQQSAPALGGWPDLFGRISRRVDSLLSIPSEIALRAANRAGPDAAKPGLIDQVDLSALNEHDVGIVGALYEMGAAVTTLEALGLPGTPAMMAAADDLQQRLDARYAPHEMARRHTVSARPGDVLARDALLRWALNDRLLDIVEAYIAGPAAYDGLLFYRSHPDGREEGVREWHRDREDSRMLKVAIYLTDVDEAGGPFEMLTPDYQRLVDAREGWKYPVMDSARLETGIPAAVRETGVRTITGKRGTVMFADAARFHHRGKPPTRNHRDAIFHSFFSRSPRHPYCCERSMMTRAQIAAFADTLPARARAAMLWRESLPLRKRLIPPNRVKI